MPGKATGRNAAHLALLPVRLLGLRGKGVPPSDRCGGEDGWVSSRARRARAGGGQGVPCGRRGCRRGRSRTELESPARRGRPPLPWGDGSASFVSHRRSCGAGHRPSARRRTVVSQPWRLMSVLGGIFRMSPRAPAHPPVSPPLVSFGPPSPSLSGRSRQVPSPQRARGSLHAPSLPQSALSLSLCVQVSLSLSLSRANPAATPREFSGDTARIQRRQRSLIAAHNVNVGTVK